MTTPSVIAVEPLRAADVMSSPAIVVSPAASMWEAWRVMTASGLRHLIVCAQDRVVGVIDDRAVFAQWPMGPLTLRRMHVGDVMRPRTSCVLATTEARRLAEVMIVDAADAVPVVDEDGKVLGVVTSSDLTVAVAAHGLWSEP